MKASRVDSGVDRVRVRELKDAEDARFREAHPRSAALLERGRRVMPNGVPMAWMVGSYHHLPLWVESGSGAHFTDVDGHVVPRLQHRRPVDVLRLRAGAGRPSRERPDRPRQPVHAAGRGRDRRLGGARPALRPAQVAVHELGDPREHRGHPRRPGRDRPREGRHVRRQVPRPPRRGAGRAGRDRSGRHRGARRPRGHGRRHGPRPVQRPGGARPRARAPRRRASC